ncbi:MAG: YfcE family phosphodiesterase [Anaerolineales bacterium]|nr:YfcE family phosphodiesterase [Anaerolineales bacterium]
MKIAVISDTHDQIWRLGEILPDLGKADVLLHCGDLCSPFMVHALGKELDIPVHIVLGNNDGDILALKNAADSYENLHLYARLASFDLAGLQVVMTHYPEIARPVAATGEYDLVVYGHDHTAFHEKVGNSLLLNPGEFMGLFGTSSWAIFDTETGNISLMQEDIPHTS